jgi:O-antigen ligase
MNAVLTIKENHQSKEQLGLIYILLLALTVIVVFTNDSAREWLKFPIGNFHFIERDFFFYPLALIFLAHAIIEKKVKIGFFGGPLLCIIGIYYIGAVYGYAHGNTIKDIFFHIRQVNYLLVYFIFIRYIGSKEHIILFLKVISGCIVLSAGVTIVLAIVFARSNLTTRTEFFWITGGAFGHLFHIRMAGAFFFGIVLDILFAIGMLHSKAISRQTRLLLTALIVVALILTVVRSLWAGTIASIAIIVFFVKRRIKAVIYSTGTVAAFAIIALALFHENISGYIVEQSALSFETESIAIVDRMMESEIALESIQKNLCFGRGLGATIVTSLISVGESVESSFCHNSYLTILMFFGISGAIVYILVIAIIGRRCTQIYKELSSQKDSLGASLVLGCIAGLGGLLVCSIAVAAMNYSTGFTFIGITMGVINQSAQLSKAERLPLAP